MFWWGIRKEWGWSNTGMRANRGCEISILGDVKNMSASGIAWICFWMVGTGDLQKSSLTWIIMYTQVCVRSVLKTKIHLHGHNLMSALHKLYILSIVSRKCEQLRYLWESLCKLKFTLQVKSTVLNASGTEMPQTLVLGKGPLKVWDGICLMITWWPEVKNFCQGVSNLNSELSEVKCDATEGIKAIVIFTSYKIIFL